MLIFRKMIEADKEAISILENETFSDAWTEKSICDTFHQKQAFITIAEWDGKVAGYCIVYHAMDEGEIARIAVDEKYRRQGIGRELLDYTCKCCREKQIGRLLLDVRESNQGARAFYEGYGFSKDGIRKDFYERPKENAVLMSKIIA